MVEYLPPLGVERDALLTLRRWQRNNQAKANPVLAQRTAQIRTRYPWVPGEATYALAQLDAPIESGPIQRAALASGRAQASRGFGRIGDLLKATVRGGFTLLQSPIQEVQGLLRAGWGAMLGDEDPMGQIGASTGAMAIKALLRGQRVDLGTGFLPSGQIWEQHARTVRSAGPENPTFVPGPKGEKARKFFEEGPNAGLLSPGRTSAFLVTEPGTTSFNVLSGLIDAFFGFAVDPSAKVLKTTSEIRKAKKVFEAGGLADAVRRTTAPQKVAQWLDGEGKQVIKYLTETSDVATIWKTTGKKIPIDTVVRLADAPTQGAVNGVLREALGVGVRNKPTLRRPIEQLPIIRKDPRKIRLLSSMPGKYMDGDDLDSSVEVIDRLGKNFAMDPGDVNHWINQMARTTDRFQRMGVLTDMLKDSRGPLVSAGMPASTARRMTELFGETHQEMRRYFVNQIGDNVHVPGARVDGAGRPLASPHLYVELLDRLIPLPDNRAIRRATSKYGAVLNNPAIKVPEAMYEFFVQMVWKPAMLARGAWTVRVVGEEQFRMAASGLDSLVSHPGSALAWMVGRSAAELAEDATRLERLGAAVKKGAAAPIRRLRKAGRGEVDALGKRFEAVAAETDLDKFTQALTRGSMGLRDDPHGVKRLAGKLIYNKGDEHYTLARADELARLESDPVSRVIASAIDETDSAKTWFWTGPGQKFRKILGRAPEDPDVPISRRTLFTRAGADNYIELTKERILTKTGGDRDLIRAIATGAYRGRPIRDGLGISPKFKRALERIEDTGPEWVMGDNFAKQAELGATWNRMLETMFNTLMSRPTNLVSRSPTFRQFYWQRMDELVDFLDEGARVKLLNNARKAKLPADDLERMAQKAKRPPGNVTLEQADTVAKGFGLDSTKHLLYELKERSQFFDMTRHLFPFGEAFKEVLTRWAEIGWKNPQVIRRGQQAIEGFRGADVNEDGRGFFYTDEFGQEVFAYPGSRLLSEALLDVPIPLKGSVEGLNLAGNFLPGFGPVVQIPVSWFLPEVPEYDWVRDVVLPFGEVDTEGGLVEANLPAWAKKLLLAMKKDDFPDQRMFANATSDMANWLASTDEYDLSDQDDMNRLWNDAKGKARGLFFLRAAAQFFAPSAPRPEMLAQDPNGNLVVAQTLIEDYRTMYDEDPTTAVQRFLEKYGESALLYMQPKSESLAAAPVTEEGSRWARANPDLREKFPTVYGYFAPEGGEFDYTAYDRQFEAGERELLTADKRIRLANNRVARMIYEQARRKTDGSREHAAWLRQIKAALREEYPGFDEQPVGKPEVVINELIRASENEKLAATPPGEALTLYLAARTKAQEAATEGGYASFAAGAGTRGVRDWLRDIGEALASEYPEFGPMWERALLREFPRDEEIEEVVVGDEG